MVHDLDTLAHHRGRPLVVKHDLRETPLKKTIECMNTFFAHVGGKPEPEHDAYGFYYMNHLYGLLQTRFSEHEPLGKYQEVAETYFEDMAVPTCRAFYYLLLICTRESRHVHTQGNIWTRMENKYGSTITHFEKMIHGTSSDGAASKLRSGAPDCTLGDFTDMLEWVFFEGKFSSSYGGPAWGAVAKCLNSFVKGEYSAEMMMDTVWTLCHNNGPIFNKGMLYSMYSDTLVKILDVQRSGQIPQLINDHINGSQYLGHIPQQVIQRHGKFKSLFEEINTFCDWYMVEALGSNKSYNSFKSQQLQKHGPSNYSEKIEKLQQEKKQAEALKKQMEDQMWFNIGQKKLKKLTRAQVKQALSV